MQGSGEGEGNSTSDELWSATSTDMVSMMILNPLDILVWGGLATLLLTLVMAGSQGLGWSRISLPYLLGTMVTPRRGRAMWIGFGLHVGLGLFFALLYALVFESLGRSDWWIGLLLGIAHGLFLLTVVVTLIGVVHPRMANKHHGPTPTRQLEPPGFMATHYGHWTPITTLVAHIGYGVLFGGLYEVASRGAVC